MRADVDGDGIVRIPDLSRVASDYRVDVPPAPARYNQGPPPFDSVINITDPLEDGGHVQPVGPELS